MIEESIFKSNQEINLYVKEIYGLNIKNTKKLDRGSANIYVLENDENKYILKEFQSSYQKDDIEKEINIINHLRKYNINVPKYIKSVQSKYYNIYKNKIIIIQKFIDGYTLNNNEGNYYQTIECAEYYGKIVKALITLEVELPKFDMSYYSKDNCLLGIKKHEKLLNYLDDNKITDKKIKSDILEKISMTKEIINSINFEEMEKVTILNTHGDYNVLQLLYKDGKINAVIDFASACKMPISWELIRSYSYIDKDAKEGIFNLVTFTNYVKKFNEYVKLNKYDLKYMVYLYLIQILNSDFGYKQYIYDRKNIKLLEFGYFRTNICRYLFENIGKITKRLDNLQDK